MKNTWKDRLPLLGDLLVSVVVILFALAAWATWPHKMQADLGDHEKRIQMLETQMIWLQKAVQHR